ncbi:MAG: carbamoyltransferase [Candidatus Hydrogenedentes bacterium]|nr:carbamoyltransferase [Candidatus Hydrogenedentota bacterium]
MNILGIGGFSHDSAAVLVCDGELVAGVAEERITRVKHQGGVPREAVQYCLDAAGLTRNHIDHIGCYMKPGLRLRKRLAYRTTQLLRSPLYSLGYMGYEVLHNIEYMRGMRSLCGAKTKLHYMAHHPAHAASAFLVSPFDSAALLSIDYIGEMTSTWAGVGQGTTLTPLKEIRYPHSLGVFYSAITDYLGFLRASDEYKVMGLASYGEPEFYDDFRAIVREHGKHWYKMDLSWMAYHHVPGSRNGYFSNKFLKRFGPPREKGEPVEERHRNIAASAQKILEETVLRMLRHLHQIAKSDNLCLAGGVALNCAMNGRVLRESPFESVFVQPASGDDGIAIGAAYQLHHRMTGQPRSFVMRDACIGPEHSNEEIRRYLEQVKIPFETPENYEARVAELIAEGNIVGWYQGRMEYGPRALGARSILADPTRPEMKDMINKHVKHREEFRPFAPSCLEEKAGAYFEDCNESPFMLFVYPVIEEMRDEVPSVTHVDGTSRVQTVSEERQPQFYRLISEFERLKEVPMILNTSFNVMGEPIVNTPAQAVRCFYSTGMDALAIGDCIVTKQHD